MKQTLRDHPYAAAGFALATAVTLFFLVRAVVLVIYWSDPAHHNEVVKPWMTVGYIAKSWDLDPREIDRLTGLPRPEGHGPWTLQEVAEARGVPVEEIIAQLNAALALMKAEGKGSE